MRQYFKWVDKEDNKYYSLFFECRLVSGEPARCVRHTAPAPRFNCECGYYSTRDLITIFAYAPDDRVDPGARRRERVLLQVHPYGVVLEDRWGVVRSEFIQVLGEIDPRSLLPPRLRYLPFWILQHICNEYLILREKREKLQRKECSPESYQSLESYQSFARMLAEYTRELSVKFANRHGRHGRHG